MSSVRDASCPPTSTKTKNFEVDGEGACALACGAANSASTATKPHTFLIWAIKLLVISWRLDFYGKKGSEIRSDGSTAVGDRVSFSTHPTRQFHARSNVFDARTHVRCGRPVGDHRSVDRLQPSRLNHGFPHHFLQGFNRLDGDRSRRH